jgi:hypothetical protein
MEIKLDFSKIIKVKGNGRYVPPPAKKDKEVADESNKTHSDETVREV